MIEGFMENKNWQKGQKMRLKLQNYLEKIKLTIMKEKKIISKQQRQDLIQKNKGYRLQQVLHVKIEKDYKRSYYKCANDYFILFIIQRMQQDPVLPVLHKLKKQHQQMNLQKNKINELKSIKRTKRAAELSEAIEKYKQINDKIRQFEEQQINLLEDLKKLGQE